MFATGICFALYATLQAACYALYVCQPALSLCLKVLLWVEAVSSTLWTILWPLEVIAVAYNMCDFYGCESVCMYIHAAVCVYIQLYIYSTWMPEKRKGRAAWDFGVICLSLWEGSTITAAPEPGPEEPLIESGVNDDEVQMTVEQA